MDVFVLRADSLHQAPAADLSSGRWLAGCPALETWVALIQERWDAPFSGSSQDSHLAPQEPGLPRLIPLGPVARRREGLLLGSRCWHL